jgi:hypothetical protein
MSDGPQLLLNLYRATKRRDQHTQLYFAPYTNTLRPWAFRAAESAMASYGTLRCTVRYVIPTH